MKNKIKKAFTLVELIVVITILAILWTIGFMGFQSYNTFARDSVRLWNLKTLESSLWIMYVQSWNYALPDDSVNITASWTLIRKQWVFWKNALRSVNVSKNWSRDPLTTEYFDYTVWANLQEYQLVTYLEWDETNNIISNSYANIWTMKTIWSDIWIVFSWWLEVHKKGLAEDTEVDIRENNKEYTVKFNEWDEITSSWSLLFSSIYNHSKKLLKNKELAKLDDSLVLYFDMETVTVDWKMKDLSNYWNHWLIWKWLFIWEWFLSKSLYFPWENHWSLIFNWFLRTNNILWSWNNESIDWITLWLNLKPLMDNNYYTYRWEWSSSEIKKSIFKTHITNTWKWWIIFYIEDWKLWLWLRSVSTDSIEFFLSNIIVNEWEWVKYSVSVDFFSKKAKFYKNWSKLEEHLFSNLSSNKYIPDDILTTDNLWYSTWYSRYKWFIDEAYFYNRALSESEIKNVYGSTLKN
jgi:prepilin-type N-terminal cleavage/methylation domain-containing protein